MTGKITLTLDGFLTRAATEDLAVVDGLIGREIPFTRPEAHLIVVDAIYADKACVRFLPYPKHLSEDERRIYRFEMLNGERTKS
jgi:predicted GTPase